MKRIKQLLSIVCIAGAVLIPTAAVLTGCASFGGGSDLSSTLSGLDQTVEQAYQQYRAGVAAGQIPPDARIDNYYLQYKFIYGAFSGVLKPKATPPEAVVTAKTDLLVAIAENKTKAKAAKQPAPAP